MSYHYSFAPEVLPPPPPRIPTAPLPLPVQTKPKAVKVAPRVKLALPSPTSNGRIVFLVPEYPGTIVPTANTLATFVSLTMIRSFTEIYELVLSTEEVYKVNITYCSGGHKRTQWFWSVGSRFLFSLPCAKGKVELTFTAEER